MPHISVSMSPTPKGKLMLRLSNVISALSEKISVKF